MRASSRILAAAATAGLTLLAGTTGVPVANASTTGTAPFTVEDYSYPGADRILAESGIRLKSGNGNITLTTCSSGAGLLRIMARTRDDICFRMTGAVGRLSLEVPRVHGIQSDGVRDVSVSMSVDGATTSFKVDKNLWTAVGEAADPQSRPHTLLDITATGPGPANSGPSDRPYVANLDIGGRGCTGTLVDPRWVLTTASCFADNPAQSLTIPAGAPKKKTTATIGRGDLNGTGGHTTDIVELVPRTDRDLVMARLDLPAYGITPVAVASTAPVQGEELKVTGYGRTRTEWVPAAPHTAAFSVGAVEATGIDVTAKAPVDATVCLGDAGGPAVREVGGKAEVVAVTSRSWQGGCLTATETRTGAYETRVDDLGPWITALQGRRSAAAYEAGTGRLRFADFDGDGKPDYLTVEDSGAVKVWLNRGGDQAGGWQGIGQVAIGVTNDRTRVRFADFDGDGKADYIVINPDGSVNVWLNRGGDQANGWQPIGRVAAGVTNRQDQVRFADFDGDGRSDYLVIDDSGAIKVWLNRGGDQAGGWQGIGQIATGVTNDRARARFADFDGDGKADYIVINPDGSVNVYLNRGGDQAGSTGWDFLGRVATGLTTDNNSVFLTDFTGDGRADYLWNPGDGTTNAYANKGGDGRGGWEFLSRIASGA
ncbi:FG-GAP-like repeat-containing protein [Kitasatospora sp. NBC_01300]|uniref:FG-GAP-like repeat-containing protein n=1 Tax=Kitasatospora sp. NBC_01300 TaxID=2903574 RepID=UPI00352C5AE3|nr:FG-GAP-like repeat-containing protein [Kitasatospora sp. NBC_01300]